MYVPLTCSRNPTNPAVSFRHAGRFALQSQQAHRASTVPMKSLAALIDQPAFPTSSQPGMLTNQATITQTSELNPLLFVYSQAAATRALNNHTDLASVLDLMQRVTPRLRAPIVLFTYYNPIMKRGVEKFVQDAKAAGAAGERSSFFLTFF
jgi:hypothetical protein